jgi:hypothetical protein
VIWGILIQTDPQKLPQPQRAGGLPGDATLPIDALEVSDQKQAEIRSRRQRTTSDVIGVEAGALLLGKLIEFLLVQEFVQTCIRRECPWFFSKMPENRGVFSKWFAAVGRFPKMQPQSPSGFSF